MPPPLLSFRQSPLPPAIVSSVQLVLVSLVALSAACDESPVDPDAELSTDGHAADTSTDADGETTPDVTPGEPASDGSTPDAEGARFVAEDVALVARDVRFTTDRIFDLDGDGIGDNAIAELGSPSSESALILFDALAEAARDDGYGPGLFFPVLADRGDSLLIALSGDGAALGGELRAPYESMDGCGEPAFAHSGRILAGDQLFFDASDYPMLVSDAVGSGRAVVSGRLSVDDGGLVAETEECVAATIESLGRARGPTQTRGLTLLEVLLAGGSALGMAGAPGLSPDVDLDGDGLERVLLGSDGLVSRCVDGDATTIEGRGCWADDRMADAFALCRRIAYEETTFAGRFDGWLSYCEAGYASPSLFGEGWEVSGDWQIALGYGHSCLRSPDGMVRCWGFAGQGQLGYGNTDTVGDDEPACTAGAVDVGAGVLSIMAATASTCAILPERRARCWGDLWGEGEPIGDDETPAAGDDLALGAPVQQIVSGRFHSCALLSGGRVRCWGQGDMGQLGQGSPDSILAAEAADAPDVPLGGRAVALAASGWHSCALLDGGAVRCWGRGAEGQLGYGSVDNVGDDERAEEAGDVDLGGPARAIATGTWHTCAVLDDGSVRCWGKGEKGQLGYGSVANVGDDESPASAGSVDLGGPAVDITAGEEHSCALLEGGTARCWGYALLGQLGYRTIENVGDDERPASMGAVDVGGTIESLIAGAVHTCALVSGGVVRCWGSAYYGQLGYGSTENVGDDESPASAGNVPVICGP